MEKRILWVDDSADMIRHVTDYFSKHRMVICNASNLYNAIYELELCSNQIKYDYIIIDVCMPPIYFDPREGTNSKVYNDPDGWNGYLYFLDIIDFLNDNYNGRFALFSGYLAERVQRRLICDGVSIDKIHIFEKSKFDSLDKIYEWINGTTIEEELNIPGTIKTTDNIFKSQHEIMQDNGETKQLSNLEILWIDDESIPLRIIDSIVDNGISVRQYRDILKFMHDYNQKAIIEGTNNLIIIIDIVMQDDSKKLIGTRDGEQTGLVLAREILRKNPKQKIIGCSSWGDIKIKNWFWEHCDGFIDKDSETLSEDILKRLNEILYNKRLPRTFIVHGWDAKLRDELRDYLVNDLEFPDPIVLAQMSSVGKTIVEKIEEATTGVDLVFVLCTPDDTVISNGKTYRQARPNVLIELGYFYGKLGRLSGKVIVIIKGDLNIPSDISGVTYIQIKDSLLEARKEIKNELNALRLIDTKNEVG